MKIHLFKKEYNFQLSNMLSLTAICVTVVFSIKNCCQSNRARSQSDIALEQSAEAIDITKRAEKQGRIDRLKHSAKAWFDKAEEEEALKIYEEVKLLDSTDNEGYRLFYTTAQDIIRRNNGKCDTVAISLLHMAKKLKETDEVNKQIELCEER